MRNGIAKGNILFYSVNTKLKFLNKTLRDYEITVTWLNRSDMTYMHMELVTKRIGQRTQTEF